MFLLYFCDFRRAVKIRQHQLNPRLLPTRFVRCTTYGAALASRIDKIIGLFCKRDLWKRRYSAKETCNSVDPTHRSHPIPEISSTLDSLPTREKIQKRLWYVVNLCLSWLFWRLLLGGRNLIFRNERQLKPRFPTYQIYAYDLYKADFWEIHACATSCLILECVKRDLYVRSKRDV